MSDCGCHVDAKNAAERRTLRVLFSLNGIMFLVGLVAGILAHSTALIADSLDMFADATVYALSLYAVGKTARDKNRAACFSGFFQIALAGMVLGEVIRRFLSGSAPEASWMMGIAFLSLIANSYGLYLILKHRKGDIHMRASWIFTQNDTIANLSTIVAGVLVTVFNSRFPDLIVGFAIALLVLRGGIAIVRDVRQEQAKHQRSNYRF